jgi:cysteine sulfinate desulfinase/cysteine desulfurase-like protein
MGVPMSRAAGTLRLTVSPDNTEVEIKRVLKVLPDIVERSRASTPATA